MVNMFSRCSLAIEVLIFCSRLSDSKLITLRWPKKWAMVP